MLYTGLTYLYEPLPKIPYRRRLGGWGRGKSAFVEAAGVVAYRGMILAGYDTTAAIRNMFDFWRGTAIIDEADWVNSDLYSSIVKILNIGFSNLTG